MVVAGGVGVRSPLISGAATGSRRIGGRVVGGTGIVGMVGMAGITPTPGVDESADGSAGARRGPDGATIGSPVMSLNAALLGLNRAQ